QGGGEATGLVTRFTLKKQTAPKGFPVAFRLLSELDVVKILTNTYLSDFKDEDERPARPEEVHQVLDRLKPKRRSTAADNLSIEAFYDLRDYVERYFRGHEFIKALGPAYWSEAERLGPYLEAGDRAELLSFLWGRHEFFTRIYTRLQAALAQLGHAEQAYAAIEALREPGAEPTQGPRRDSIIDVNTLWALNDPTAESITVATDDGKRVRLPRPLATALIAELRIKMQKQPWPFFEHTDLLDFPGARVRENYRVEQVQQNPELVPRCFLRGKVAYLFERYCADLELSSMLLCIGPSNQEVRTLPKMIEEWVAATHGSTPEERARQETVLFFVLTKFDTEFDEKAGKLDPALAFDTRLRHSLTEFFGATGEWVHEWHPRTPFRNTYWLRSPNAYAEGLFAFSDDKRELAIHPHKVQRLAEIKPLYLETELVQRHFDDPERAWEEGLRLNDGGVTYLAEQLEPVCNPGIKRRQVAARLIELATQVREALAPFFISGDLAEEREKRLAQALATITELEFAAEEGRFGRFIHAFQVEEDQLASLYLRVAAERSEELAADLAPQRQRGSGRLLGRLSGAAVPQVEAPKAGGGDRRAERFAAAALEAWMDEMRQQAAGDALPSDLRVAGGVLTGVVSELAQAARRLALQERIAQRLAARAGTPKQPKQAMASGALVASEAINRFVATLGFGETVPGQRPVAQDASGRDRPIFTRPPIVGDQPNLPAERQPPGEQSAVDWMAAYLRLVEDNASTLDGRAIDLEQNRRLGQLLGNLRAVENGFAG
ncbi:MAG TPA: virulence factor SrfC family protein, partial [Kiloniellales bacterium]|nr:virulence factor SrfC family protein [Kiloniellales bacterium]